ncbi:hypothetical protein FOZ63_020421, partial [Perkinsus olseni]
GGVGGPSIDTEGSVVNNSRHVTDSTQQDRYAGVRLRGIFFFVRDAVQPQGSLPLSLMVAPLHQDTRACMNLMSLRSRWRERSLPEGDRGVREGSQPTKHGVTTE